LNRIPFYLISLNNKAEINGVLSFFYVRSVINGRRLVSLPFSHCIKILYNNKENLDNLLKSAKKLSERLNLKYFEIRHGSNLAKATDLLDSCHLCSSKLKLTHEINKIHNDFDSNVKRAIRKAEKSPLKIIHGNKLEHYYSFFKLTLETRKRQGSPCYPFQFFKNLYYGLTVKGKAKLYLACFQGEYIAGIIMLYHNRCAIYGYGASTSDKDYLKLRPNNLLFWHAIKKAHKNGYKVFDLGATPYSNKGLLRFKSGWGTEQNKLPYYYYLNSIESLPVIDRKGKLATLGNTVFKKMPLSVSRIIGPLILKQLG